MNECAIRADNCGENSVCVNKPGSFKCECKDGYYKESGSKQCVEGTMHGCSIMMLINGREHEVFFLDFPGIIQDKLVYYFSDL